MAFLRSTDQIKLRKLKRERSMLRILSALPTVELENALMHRLPMTQEQAIDHVSRFPVSVIEQAYKNKGGVTSREGIMGMTTYQLWECLSARCSAAIINLELPPHDGMAMPEMATWSKGSYTHCSGLAHAMGAWARRRDDELMEDMCDETDDDAASQP